ncbi:MAG TPA: DegT/DnrJ/EryC1/StrS family aminotransferase [Terriglobia bacterium]|nr:DegT/DnrJ/EryC1/StrS family aminotransferase [Terriglobia bacterium]
MRLQSLLPVHEQRRGGNTIRTVPIAQVSLDRREIRAVEQVLKTGNLRAGKVTEEFEESFAASVGARHAIAVTSGTAALFLACYALLRPGDEVIVPDFTFAATATMAAAVGARPVFADVNPRTFTLEPAEVERHISPQTRALIPVHLYGQPADIGGLARLARRHKLKIIWDAAQAHGAQFRGRDVGSFPDAVCYSFYPTKNMTTGEGGMITTSNSSLAAELRLLRSHGDAGRYRHVRLGFNFRTTDIASAIGRVQLARLPKAIRARQKNAKILSKELSGIPGLQTPEMVPGTGHAFSLFTICVDAKKAGMSRDELAKSLQLRGIQSAVHYPLPLHRQPVFRGYGLDRDYPVSARLAKSVLSLPVYPGVREKDLHYIIRSVREILKG